MPGTRLIAIDMDGTLLHSDGHVSERNLAAIRAAEAQGVEVVIATGRRHCYAMRVLRELDRPAHTALVSSNGTVIRTLGSELLHREHMPLETARWLCEHVTDFRGTLVLTFDKVRADGEDDRGSLVCERLDELSASIGRWIDANEPYFEQVSPIEHALDDAAPIQMMLCGPINARSIRIVISASSTFCPQAARRPLRCCTLRSCAASMRARSLRLATTGTTCRCSRSPDDPP
jgi:hydroxymethylpyrimidine pyrophosphatase-like HAD family hydrolase